MDVEITAENVGQNYRGTAEAGGKLDLEKVLEEKMKSLWWVTKWSTLWNWCRLRCRKITL